MAEYRYQIDATICFSVYAADDAEADRLAAEAVLRSSVANGQEISGPGSDPVVYHDDDAKAECVDVVEDEDDEEEPEDVPTVPGSDQHGERYP